MTRRALVGTAALIVVAGAVALSIFGWREAGLRRSAQATAPERREPGRREPAALLRLQTIPLYRALVRLDGLRSATLDAGGALHLDVDVRAIAAPRLPSLGLSGLAGLLPVLAQGTIVTKAASGGLDVRESWVLPGPVPLFDLLDRAPANGSFRLAWDAIPGNPSAVVRARLQPQRLLDETLGGPAFATWRDRVSLAEKLLDRPLREQFAKDLAGPVVVALFEGATGTEAEVLAAVELRRSDRISELFDTLLGLGALTERAKIARYRGVATGSYVSDNGGPGLAVAVDGPILLVASSRALLETAIDKRRQAESRPREPEPAADDGSSWSAVSSSSFVSEGWCRLVRCGTETAPPTGTTTASLRPLGASGWRIDSHGCGPAIAADPIVPYLRTLREPSARR